MHTFRQKWSLCVNLGLACATILFFTVCAELMLRMTGSFYPARMGWVGQFQNRRSANFIDDAQTGWRMRPNHSFVWTYDGHADTYRSNSQGFRSAGDFDTHDHRLKLAFVGDSFFFGTGVANEDTIPSVVEKAAPGRIAWNFGMPGFGVDQIWLSARYQALPLKPDVLVVGLVNADFARSQVPYRRLEGFSKPTFKLVHGKLLRRATEQPPNILWRNIDERSRLGGMWQDALRWAGVHLSLGEYWTLNQAILDAIREDCRSAGVPVLFVYIPAKGFRPFQALPLYMQRTGAAYIDLTQQRPVPPPSIYLQHDMHLSAEGNRYVAELIEQRLRSYPPLTARVHP